MAWELRFLERREQRGKTRRPLLLSMVKTVDVSSSARLGKQKVTDGKVEIKKHPYKAGVTGLAKIIPGG